METPKQIAIFASGSGSNAENIIKYFQDAHCGARVGLVISNRSDAFVLQRAAQLGVPALVISRDDLTHPETLLALMARHHIHLIVLAGFLLKIPQSLIQSYPGRIVNIHPALLPKFGGKGMYGRHVHEAVVAAGETITGITIHYVTENYDEGNILFQATTPVDPGDTASDLARKVQALEHQHFARVIHRTFFV